MLQGKPNGPGLRAQHGGCSGSRPDTNPTHPCRQAPSRCPAASIPCARKHRCSALCMCHTLRPRAAGKWLCLTWALYGRELQDLILFAVMSQWTGVVHAHTTCVTLKRASLQEKTNRATYSSSPLAPRVLLKGGGCAPPPPPPQETLSC